MKKRAIDRCNISKFRLYLHAVFSDFGSKKAIASSKKAKNKYNIYLTY